MTVGVLTNYFWFMDLGLGQATVKYVAEHVARDEPEEVNRVYWMSVGAYVVLGAIAAAAIIAVAPLCVYRWFVIPEELQGPALRVFGLSAVGFALGLVNNAPAAIPRALQRFDVVNITSAAAGTAQTIATVALLAAGGSVQGIVLANVLVVLGSLVSNAIIAQRLASQISLPVWHRATLRKLIGFGGFVAVSGLVVPLLVNAEKLILSGLSVSAVAYYTVSYNVSIRLVWMVAAAVFSMFLPVFSELAGKGRTDLSLDFASRVTQCLIMLPLPVVIVLWSFGHELLEIWMGQEFAKEGSGALQVLAIATLINATTSTPIAFLQATGRPAVIAKIHVAEVIVHIPVVLLCVTSFGLLGAALAWLCRVVIDSIAVWAAMIRVSSLDWRAMVVRLMSGPLVGLLVGGLVLWVAKQLLQGQLSPSHLLFGLGGTFLVVSYGLMLMWGGLAVLDVWPETDSNPMSDKRTAKI
jgi:O-antigen/teichoic acid export membrane protein